MRLEYDSMGTVEVPEQALWGAQTQRAIQNFPISGQTLDPQFITALVQVKRACAWANIDLGLLDTEIGNAITQACDEIIAGEHPGNFPLDIFQTGSGTSTNMNANEVIANRAIEIMGGEVGTRTPVHPNDHVNLGQSSNDVFPTATHVAVTLLLRQDLIPALEELHTALSVKSEAFDPIVKTGRTHLQDATPIRLGQVFGGYAAQVDKCILRVRSALEVVKELPLGGTAVGTGLNRHPDFPRLAISHLNQAVDADFYEAPNHIEANASRDGLVSVSGQIKSIAVSVAKIANDIRWMASGPRGGLGELRIPAVQPGSSIMPGKVNPVMAEALIMVAAQVIGHDTAITLGGLGGYFELNLMMPLLAFNLVNSITWLSSGISAFTTRCVSGLEADRDRIRENLEGNLALATGLAPVIGYDKAAQISKEALQSGRTVRQVAADWGILSTEELERYLDPFRMTTPGIPRAGEPKD